MKIELPLPSDCIFRRGLWFVVHQNHWTSASRPQSATTFVVNFHALIDVGTVADIEAVVGTTNDVNKEGICFRRCRHEKPYDALRLLRAFDSLLRKRKSRSSAAALTHRAVWPAVSERSESNGASGTPIELFMAAVRYIPSKSLFALVGTAWNYIYASDKK